MFSPTQVRSSPPATWVERSTKNDCYYVVQVRACFSDKATKINKVFSHRECWIDEGRQARPWSAQLDLHVAGGQIILT